MNDRHLYFLPFLPTLIVCVVFGSVGTVVYAQNSDAFDHPYLESIFQSNKGGLLRGVEINFTKQKVEARETAQFLKDSYNSITYEILFDELSMNFADVEYVFDSEDRLLKIHLDVYLETDSVTDILLNKLKQKFENEYGRSRIDENGYLFWQHIGAYSGSDERYRSLDIGLKKYAFEDDFGLLVEITGF